jgi:hypothetical protein
MQYNTRAILAMIASALTIDSGETYRWDIIKVARTSDRNALICYMADGRQFQIAVEEVL